MKKELIKDYLEGLNNTDLVALHNDYCEKSSYNDDQIYNLDDDFIETHFPDSPKLARQLSGNRNFNFNDDYVRYDGYGNLETTDYPDDSDWINLDEIADYAIDEDEDFGDDEIREILDNEDEETPE
jgi:hypothetical protein